MVTKITSQIENSTNQSQNNSKNIVVERTLKERISKLEENGLAINTAPSSNKSSPTSIPKSFKTLTYHVQKEGQSVSHNKSKTNEKSSQEENYGKSIADRVKDLYNNGLRLLEDEIKGNEDIKIIDSRSDTTYRNLEVTKEEDEELLNFLREYTNNHDKASRFEWLKPILSILTLRIYENRCLKDFGEKIIIEISALPDEKASELASFISQNNYFQALDENNNFKVGINKITTKK